MCLGVPGKVVRWIERAGPFARADIEFDGVRRLCHMACVPQAEVGEYVLIHAGIAISLIDESEAARLLHDLNELLDGDHWPRGDESALGEKLGGGDKLSRGNKIARVDKSEHPSQENDTGLSA